MGKIRVAINGFGRIGRLALRAMYQYDKEGLFEIVATNSRTTPEQRAYMFKYDSIHRRFPGDVSVDGDNLVVNGQKIKVLAIKNPEDFNWKDLGVDIVIESSGVYKTLEDAQSHLKAGAKKVVITAPGSGGGIPTFVMGVNEDLYNPSADHVISNASCTTNCLAPIVRIINEAFGIERGLMTTTHSYTNDQKLMDSSHKKLHRGRAAALSMVPTSTGAAKAIGLVIPELKGKMNGIALRVPTPDVSVVDLVAELRKEVTAEALNEAVRKRAQSDMKHYVVYEEEDLVSSDFIGDEHSSIFAALHTMAIGNMVKILAWYDNEWGYTCRCIDLVNYIIKKGL